jgi:phospholipid-binding lipoprotein MlaA
MRRLILPALLLAPVCALAQIIVPPMPAQKRAAFEACLAQTNRDEHAVLACLRKIDEARTPPAQQQKPPPPVPQPQPQQPPVPVPPPAAPAPAETTPTQAEQDYDAIYGQGYNPVADSSLPAPAQLPATYDPWEKLNRKVHGFNNVVDRHIARPLAHAYVAVVPRPVRLGVGNFFSNLGQPISAFNALLQGKPKQAAQALGRFALNSTLGWGGLFDPASNVNLPHHSEDFGQTLGVWGWKRSRYVELPLFGPRTVRDVFGMVGDAPLAPIRTLQDDKARVFLQGLQLVDVRTQLMAVDSMRVGAADDYALVRDAWTQRRNYQIFGDRTQQGTRDADLPDYLQEDQDNPIVPADAMPVMPTDVH